MCSTNKFNGSVEALPNRGGPFILLIAAIALAIGLPADALRAAEGSKQDSPRSVAEFYPTPTLAEQAIDAALDSPGDFYFVDTPLQRIVDELNAKSDLRVRLNLKALDDAALSPNTPLTWYCENTTLRGALQILASQHGIYWLAVRNEIVLTTKEVSEAEENLILRVYPVGDLVGDNFAPLMDVIMECVAKDSWEEGGGVGKGKMEPSRVAKALVISQTQEVHDKVLRLLRAARAHRVSGKPLPPPKTGMIGGMG